MFRMVSVALVAAFFVLAASVSAHAQTERERVMSAFQNLEPSVGALYTVSRGGDLSFTCSVAAIDREGEQTVVLTAFHCVDRPNVSYLVSFGDNKFYTAHVWKLPDYEADPEIKRGRSDPKIDMALILVDGSDIPITPVSTTRDLRNGSKIIMVGFPLGIAKIGYEGILSGWFNRPGDEFDGYMLLQIFGAPGSSGSSVLDAQTGEIVAILVAANQARAGLPVIWATPISFIDKLTVVDADRAEAEEEDGAKPEWRLSSPDRILSGTSSLG